ncbi:MAG: AraC family transcriptional regulator, partial [Pseudomonadales bacterium]|nr:AraC family transcriptional regulator [Pseudomonadales bacterium]
FKAISYIEQHLDKTLTLAEVASAAHYSPYHFSRKFKALTGDNVTEYVRKRRLTVAADRLLHDDQITLLNLALSIGFEGQESFTKAFKNMFLTTPGQYRKQKTPTRLLQRNPFCDQEFLHLSSCIDMQPDIITRESMLIVGRPHHFVDKDLSLKTVWSGFKPEMAGIPNRIGKLGFGIYEAYYESGAEVGFTYWCAVPVSSASDIPAGFKSRIIPEQTYAVFMHRGPLPSLHETLKYIWGSWLPKSKYQYHCSPELEIYPENYDGTRVDAELKLYIPIKHHDK